MNTILENYKRCCTTPSDIYKHIPVLYKYASKCSHITEFGTRNVTSTWAFAYSFPEKIIFYDTIRNNHINNFVDICKNEGVNVIFKQEDTKTVYIEETDLLFIDTLHTYEQVKAELLNSNKVKKYIILHDTKTFGNIDYNGIGVGIKPAVEEFLNNNKDWEIEYETDINNGLMVLRNINNTVIDNNIIMGVPILGNTKLLNAALDSLKHNTSKYSIKFFFINNTKNCNDRKELFKIFDQTDCDVFDIKTNIGVPCSWNIIISNALQKNKTPYIFSTDLIFKSNLDGIFDHIETHPDKVHLVKSYNFFAVSGNIVKEIGWFDNNIFPAYTEDCDYSYRIKTSMDNYFIQNVPFSPEIDHLGSQTILNTTSDKNVINHIKQYGGYRQKYYMMKWGGKPGNETHITPFNII